MTDLYIYIYLRRLLGLIKSEEIDGPFLFLFHRLLISFPDREEAGVGDMMHGPFAANTFGR